MRLIDADEFKKQIAGMAIINNYPADKANKMCELIDLQKTAFDLDKVIKQLQGEVKQSEYYAQNFEDNGMYLESEQETKVKLALERVIEIVKKGGTA